MAKKCFIFVLVSVFLPLLLDSKFTSKEKRDKRGTGNTYHSITNPPIPTSVGFYQGDNQLIDNCPRDQVQMYDYGQCFPLLTQGPCSITQFILLDPVDNKPYCAERLCAPDRVFVFSDQLCHDPRSPGLCLPGRQLFMTAYGTPICQCPTGTYEADDGLDDDVCEPLLEQTLSCPPGKVFWFKDFSLPPECLPDPCDGSNLCRGPTELPFVPNSDGKCFQLGMMSYVCPAQTWYAIALEQLQGICSTLEDAGYQVFDDDTLAQLTYFYGPPIPRESRAPIPVSPSGSVSGLYDDGSPNNRTYGYSQTGIREGHFTADNYIDLPGTLLPDGQRGPVDNVELLQTPPEHELHGFFNSVRTLVESGPHNRIRRPPAPILRTGHFGGSYGPPASSLRSGPLSGSYGPPAQSLRSGPVSGSSGRGSFGPPAQSLSSFGSPAQSLRSGPVSGSFGPPAQSLSSFGSQAQSLSSFGSQAQSLRSGPLSGSRGPPAQQQQQQRRRLLPHASPAVVFQSPLVVCRAGSNTGVNGKCRNTILPSHTPHRRHIRAAGPVPAWAGCPSGQSYGLSRRCVSSGNAKSSINHHRYG